MECNWTTNIFLLELELKNSYIPYTLNSYIHIQDASNLAQDARNLAQDARNLLQDARNLAQDARTTVSLA